MRLHTQWSTRPEVKPAVFIYLAVAGSAWRVLASSGGSQLLRKMYRDQASAMADVNGLIAEHGGDEAWVCQPASTGGRE